MLILLFVTVFALAFGIVVYVLRTAPIEHALDRRIASLLTPADKADSVQTLAGQFARENSGSFPWLDKFFEGTRIGSYLQNLILQSQYSTSVGTMLIVTVLVFFIAAGLFYLVTSMSLISLAAACLFGATPLLWLRQKRKKRVAKFNAALPDCIEMCARALRAGHSMIGAIAIIAEEAVEPAKTEFAEVFKKQNYGLPLRDALMQMLERVPSSDLRVLVTGILVQKDTGGNLAEILDRIVFVIRERIRIQEDIRTHTAQGRLTGWILSLLPIGLLLLINLLNPGYSKVMFQDPLGRELLYGGLALLALGAFTIRQIINGIEV